MRGESIANGKIQFQLVYAQGRSLSGREVILRTLPNQLESSRYGFVVSRRIGKAVVRNRVKRLLREITRQIPVKPGWDVVLIARIPAVGRSYQELEKSVKGLFSRAGLYAGGDEVNSPGND